MKTYLGLILCGACCAVLAVGALVPRREPVPAKDAPSGSGGVWDEVDRGEDLGGQAETLVSRRHARRAVVDAVIAGRMTLEQATARFLELNQMHPECMTALRLSNPGASDEECVRRQVSDHFRRARAQSSAEAAAPRPTSDDGRGKKG
jgi:hypothetical protein